MTRNLVLFKNYIIQVNKTLIEIEFEPTSLIVAIFLTRTVSGIQNTFVVSERRAGKTAAIG